MNIFEERRFRREQCARLNNKNNNNSIDLNPASSKLLPCQRAALLQREPKYSVTQYFMFHMTVYRYSIINSLWFCCFRGFCQLRKYCWGKRVRDQCPSSQRGIKQWMGNKLIFAMLWSRVKNNALNIWTILSYRTKVRQNSYQNFLSAVVEK